MLVASHLAGVGQASGTGVGLVHALGHSIGTRGRVAHGTALAAVLPEVLRFYLGTRDRELALVGIALGVASAAETEATRRRRSHRRHRQAPPRRRPASDPSSTSASPTTASIDQLVTDTLDDAAIRNSPRLPTAPEARAILEAVAG